jgi:hypothetical protein
MKNLKSLFVLSLSTFLVACSLPIGLSAVPTQDVAQTLDAARTQAAQTVLAEIASRPSETPLPATATLAPTATELPSATLAPTLPPTNTLPPPPPATATLRPATPTITPTSTPSDYNCTITFSSPATGAQFAKRDEFDAKWTIKNTGTQTWKAADMDFKYLSGDKIHKYNDVYDLSKDVATGESIDYIVDMVAPDSTGAFRETWGLVMNTRTVCGLNVSVVVK